VSYIGCLTISTSFKSSFGKLLMLDQSIQEYTGF